MLNLNDWSPDSYILVLTGLGFLTVPRRLAALSVKRLPLSLLIVCIALGWSEPLVLDHGTRKDLYADGPQSQKAHEVSGPSPRGLSQTSAQFCAEVNSLEQLFRPQIKPTLVSHLLMTTFDCRQ